MKTTKQCIDYISSHAWYKRHFNKLKSIDELEFILNQASGDKDKDATYIIRYKLDKEKAANHNVITELAMACNSFRYL